MAIQISCLVAAHDCLWVGTENGILLTFPFNAPSVVAEETGWEVIKVRISVFVLSSFILNLSVTTYAKVSRTVHVLLFTCFCVCTLQWTIAKDPIGSLP